MSPEKKQALLIAGAHSGSGHSQGVSVNAQRIEYRNPRDVKPAPEDDDIYSNAISGHRCRFAAICAEMKHVPVLVKPISYADDRKEFLRL